MIAELQRSVTFYTKANDNLLTDNRDLEQRLYLARQRVAQINGEAGTAMPIFPEASLKSPPEELLSISPMAVKSEDESTKDAAAVFVESSHSHNAQQKQQQQNPIGAALATIPFPSLHPSVSPPSPTTTDPAQAKAQLSATQALYETMGYPTGAARVAANTFSQFVGLTGNIPSTTCDGTNNQAAAVIKVEEASLDDTKLSTVLASIPTPTTGVPLQLPQLPIQLPVEEEVGSDQYIESLHKFAMEQTSVANAAAAAANAAMQALTWHKIMKEANNNGQQQSQQQQQHPASYSPLNATSMSLSTAGAITTPAAMQPLASQPHEQTTTVPYVPLIPLMSPSTANTIASMKPPPAVSKEDEPPSKKQKL